MDNPLVIHGDLAADLNAALAEGAETVRLLMKENVRLQRVVDDLAKAMRNAHRDLVSDDKFAKVDAQAELRTALDRHGLLRPADRPECVPEAMRAGAEE